MIGIVPGTRVMVATRPMDFRKGTDSLAALVGAGYGGDLYSGVIYVFGNRCSGAALSGLVAQAEVQGWTPPSLRPHWTPTLEWL